MNEDCGRPFEVLLIEDNLADIRLTEKALSDCEFPSRLTALREGREALEFLRRLASDPQAPVPDLILLDLNLPQLNGREILAQVKALDEVRRIPVVILTSSQADADIRKCYELGANSYLVKPLEVRDFLDAIRVTVRFWAAHRYPRF